MQRGLDWPLLPWKIGKITAQRTSRTHRAPCRTAATWQVLAKEEGLRTEQAMRIQLEASVS